MLMSFGILPTIVKEIMIFCSANPTDNVVPVQEFAIKRSHRKHGLVC